MKSVQRAKLVKWATTTAEVNNFVVPKVSAEYHLALSKLEMEERVRVFSPSFTEVVSSGPKRGGVPKGRYVQHNLV
jgi:hypothetical protein